MNIEYKSEQQIRGRNFARRQFTKDNENLTLNNLHENAFVLKEPEDDVFWRIPLDIDEFNQQEEEEQIETLSHLNENIQKSFVREEVDLIEEIFIKSRVPSLIYGIFQETSSTTILEYACDIIDNWIYYNFNPDVWYDKELLTFILIFATSTSDKMTPNIFESSINIIIHFVNIKKDNFFELFELKKIINRVVNSFKNKQFFNTRNLLVQLLKSIFLNISGFDANDILILGDIFNLLPECETLDYFKDLMDCALNICEKSQEFAYCLVENIDINSIFKRISKIPDESKYSIIELIDFFLSTKDQVVMQSFMPDFKWSYILPIFKRFYEEENEKRNDLIISLQELAVNLIVANHELGDQDGINTLIGYFCDDLNNYNYKSKLTTVINIQKLLGIPNANIIQQFIDHDYIQIASDYLSSAHHYAIKHIVDSIHYIAQYAENFSLRNVIEKMASTEIFDVLPDLAQSDDKIVSESALALLNDESLTLFQSFLKDHYS